MRKFLNNSRGMTLMEIMVTLTIIVSMAALASATLFPGDDTKVQREITKLVGTIKYIYNEAAIKNRYYRIVFNIEEGNYYYRVESREEPFYLSPKEPEEEEKQDDTAETESESAEEGEQPLGEVPEAFVQEDGLILKPVQFPEEVKIKDIVVLHEPERQEFGEVPVYFLPNGWAEPMVINLSDKDEKFFYSIEVNPLTGSSKIRDEYYEINPEDFQRTQEES